MITVTSSAFKPNGPIPKRHTGEAENVSPPLAWTGIPPQTRSLALICDDPDAPMEDPFVHWVAYNIPPDQSALAEGQPVKGAEGTNNFNKLGYGGPMPPRGHGTHHYHFKLYALDCKLELAPGTSKPQLLHAMEGHILDHGELIGTYRRD